MNASVFLHTAAMLYIEILWSPLCFQSFYLLLFTAGGCDDVILTFHPFFRRDLLCIKTTRVRFSPSAADSRHGRPERCQTLFLCLFLRKRLSVGCSTVGAGEAR